RAAKPAAGGGSSRSAPRTARLLFESLHTDLARGQAHHRRAFVADVVELQDAEVTQPAVDAARREEVAVSVQDIPHLGTRPPRASLALIEAMPSCALGGPPPVAARTDDITAIDLLLQPFELHSSPD